MMEPDPGDKSAAEASGKDRRRHPRAPTFWRAKLKTARAAYECRVLDVSAEGVQLRVVTPIIRAVVTEKEAVMLIIDRMGQFTGTVAWQRKTLIGVHIGEPRMVAEFAAALSRWQQSPEAGSSRKAV